MSRRTFIGAGVAILLLIAIVGAWSYMRQRTDASSTDILSGPKSTYSNPQFGYSLAYPSTYQLHQVAPEFVSIGGTQNNAFEGRANVAVLHAQKSTPLPNFESFVRLSAGLACSQGGTGQGGVKCTSVVEAGPFTSDSGTQGEKLYFDSSTGKRGPFYVFNISQNVPDQYAVLVVYPAPTLARNDAAAALLDSIAKSIRITPR